LNYLTVNEAAALLRVSHVTIRRWIWSGKLPAIRVGRILRIRQADLEQLNGTPSGPAAPDQTGSPLDPRPCCWRAYESSGRPFDRRMLKNWKG
jgi:excisionase family DNA binding protein